jgi:aminoglycoside phosphotransferase (APT) family kinase protein
VDYETLPGGVMNAGGVVRTGRQVRRPLPPNATTLHALLRFLHASPDVPALADPAGGPVICHNDVCIENVVFRDGRAAALLDFDLAAPGRRVWDVAQAARYWIPLTDPGLPAAADRGVTDPIGRLRRFVDAYGLETDARRQFVEVALEAERGARTFVEAQAARGAAGFVEMWHEAAARRFDRKMAWIDRQAENIVNALLAGC